jgi:hypothetical protein
VGTVILRELLPPSDAERRSANGDVAAEIRQRAQRWEDLRDRLIDVRRHLGTDDPGAREFADWAKLVARYSFESGRVLGA